MAPDASSVRFPLQNKFCNWTTEKNRCASTLCANTDQPVEDISVAVEGVLYSNVRHSAHDVGDDVKQLGHAQPDDVDAGGAAHLPLRKHDDAGDGGGQGDGEDDVTDDQQNVLRLKSLLFRQQQQSLRQRLRLGLWRYCGSHWWSDVIVLTRVSASANIWHTIDELAMQVSK